MEISRRPLTSLPVEPTGPVVQLWHATLPSALRWVAVHCWFTAFDPAVGQWRRWEVWQNADAGGTSWGHVHRDLMSPYRPVGGGPAVRQAEWQGEEAERLLAVLEGSPEYPHRARYHYWPGPNSNTYAAWVLRQAAVSHDFDPRAVGKDYLGLLGGRGQLTMPGFQWESPLLGLKIARCCGVEVHLLGLTVGYRRAGRLLKTPFGPALLPQRNIVTEYPQGMVRGSER